MTEDVTRLKHWYDSKAKPFLEQHEPEKVAELEDDLGRLLSIDERASEELAVCFLGASGVGKSTLINALVAGQDVILPSGGIGPLTALAMQVRFSEEPAFEAEYQPPKNLWQLVFGLEQTYRRQLSAANAGANTPETLLDLPPDVPSEWDVEAIDPTDGQSRVEALRKQAQLLVTGAQDGDASTEYLLDCLREVLGQKRAWGTTLAERDAVRIRRLRDVLSLAKAGRVHRLAENGDRRAFLADLSDHASGFLAPLIRELRAFWDSKLLEPGLTLVDLPGIGIAGDVYRTVTRDWILKRARAVVLVTTDRGIDESNAEILKKSGFLMRLLFSIDDPTADPVVLLVAVTKLDGYAGARYAQDRSRKKKEYLVEAFARAEHLLRSQVKDQLLGAWASEGLDVKDAHRRIVDGVAETMRVFPVSAVQYRCLLAADQEDPAFISEPSQSGVPQMVDGLKSIALHWRRREHAARLEAAGSFRDRIVTTVSVIEARWQEDNRAAEDAAKLRADVEEYIAPLRRAFDIRKGAFREFLRTGVPDKIDALVKDAASEARDDIDKYLARLRDAHWATLRATVTRGGAFIGSRHINLPDDFAQRFVEPIAIIWGERLLQDIRKRTKEFTDDCVQQVEELVQWSRDQGARIKPELLEAQVASIKADTKQIQLLGKEIINDLREEVKSKLGKSIEEPIAKACGEFVKTGDHVGAGVKLRILELFQRLAKDVVDGARGPAKRVLTQKFKIVEEELKKVTARLDNPLDAARDAIVSSHEDRVKRSDAQRRKAVLASAREVLEHVPDLPPLAATSKDEVAAL